MWTVLAYVCVVIASAACQSEESRVINTHHGPVRGYRDPDGLVYSFYDVPYATAPTGTDRFKAPLPPPTWVEPYEAIQKHITCPQLVQPQISPVLIQEDCLVANIFIPSAQATNVSVVVNVHGGGYQAGHAHFVLLKNFVRTNRVIVVVFNYRLGAQGFLCLGTENAPGNAGLKDQVALLRWVQRNIANFGGNPNDVTIMGCSAGGASVDLLTLSKTTTGLFHKAIPESGCSYGGLGIQTDPLQNAKDYARLFNFTNVDDIKALEEFYLTTPYQTLVSRLDAIMFRKDSAMPFGPCVERDVGVEMFLAEDPANILKRGDYPAIPMLYGLANKEGLFRMSHFYTWSEIMNQNFSDFLPQELGFGSEAEREEVARAVKSFYFGDRYIGPQTILEYIDFFTDVLFGFKMMKAFTLRMAAKQQPIYLYEYAFVDENAPVIPYTANVTGAHHCAQMEIVFDEDKTNTTEAYRNMKTLIRSYYLNFILNGNPVPEGSSLPSWPAANITRSPYKYLGPSIELRNSMFGARFEIWNEIYDKYYKEAIPPSGNSSAVIASNVIIISIFIMFNYLA